MHGIKRSKYTFFNAPNNSILLSCSALQQHVRKLKLYSLEFSCLTRESHKQNKKIAFLVTIHVKEILMEVFQFFFSKELWKYSPVETGKTIFYFLNKQLRCGQSNSRCAASENIHIHPKEGYWKFRGGGGSNILKKSMKLK